jgi:hypothetical protein
MANIHKSCPSGGKETEEIMLEKIKNIWKWLRWVLLAITILIVYVNIGLFYDYHFQKTWYHGTSVAESKIILPLPNFVGGPWSDKKLVGDSELKAKFGNFENYYQHHKKTWVVMLFPIVQILLWILCLVFWVFQIIIWFWHGLLWLISGGILKTTGIIPT